MLIYRFLDHDAFLFGFVVPVVALLLYVIVLLVRSAVVARFTISMQVTRRAREKMRRKRHLQLFLFLKVTILIGTVAGLGVFAKLTGMTTAEFGQIMTYTVNHVAIMASDQWRTEGRGLGGSNPPEIPKF